MKSDIIKFIFKIFLLRGRPNCCFLRPNCSNLLPSQRVAVPSPRGKMGGRERLRKAGTNRVMWHQSNLCKLCKQIIFLWRSIFTPVPTQTNLFICHILSGLSTFFSLHSCLWRALHVMLYKEKLEPSDRARYGNLLRGHRPAWFPLFVSACRFIEFIDTSIICHVLVYCFGSFLLQDVFLSLLAMVVQRLDNTIQWIAWFVLLTLIHWIAIYPVDSIIQPLNNRGQVFAFEG